MGGRILWNDNMRRAKIKEKAIITGILPGFFHDISREWMIGQYITLEKLGHLYVFGAEALRIVYRDNAPGNIDLNVLINGTWIPLEIIERKGDGLTKVVIIELPESYHFLDIGIRVHGGPFQLVLLEADS